MLARKWFFLLCMASPVLGGEVHIAVAANFKDTAAAINQLFHDDTGHLTKLSSASTGVLHSQITHGAPFDILLSADTRSPRQLEAEGFSEPGQRVCYARGKLVLVGGRGSLNDLKNPNLTLAIANPATAPYGRAAREVLDNLEFDTDLEPKIVRASNVVQAYQYWFSEAVDLALVAASLSRNEGLEVPTDKYSPIEQDAVLLKKANKNAAAKRYLEFLKSDGAVKLITAARPGSRW